MPIYEGVNGVVRKRKEWPVGINGVVRQQKEHWAGIDGVQRKVFSTTESAIVTLITPQYSSWNPRYVWVVIDGVKYTSDEIVTTYVGAIMRCFLNASSYGNAYLYVNDVKLTLPQGTAPYTYVHIISKDTTVEVSSEGYPGGNTADIRIYT